MPLPPSSLSEEILAWYDRNARDMPWRLGPKARREGHRPDAYKIWLSEIMLQQTTVAAVKPFFARFVNRWPTVGDLANAEASEIMAEWAGLGYYSRARNLHVCAKEVVENHGGAFPRTAAALKALPGIGDYTSAAIASIAFDEAAPVVDGNIERVITRLYRISAPLPGAKPHVKEKVTGLTPKDRPGDFAQAMMDLGATICVPRSPSCLLCPAAEQCEARSHGDQTAYPVKAAKRPVPQRTGAAFVATRSSDGAVWLRRRPASGMLGGMAEAPSTAWSARKDGETGADVAPFKADWMHVGAIAHGFTHFKLTLEVYRAEIDAEPSNEGWWAARHEIADQGLPTLMRKVVDKALG
ncbi:A/G-specific adenine glycosylase protein [Fulvimarina pelagi HTCC2506]|uniref:Adenine DNA glycosylase n=2 Tax=Fulvimarina pelagi TaxID=217511 RepID=Q0FYE0_9HYPH|nr:A/G-specific adenine glycosylase [Fulvimarina pelagi]EAU40055.1 A/G-specific adenine glycosylase protein [Fulvimarina pelagi HTCC2506]BAT31095.1 A/G-specific adenine glycosylase protein [Fulvimarina pelagi]